MTLAGLRGRQRRRADAERERRQADDGDERAPDHEQDRDEVDVNRPSRRVVFHTSEG
jgi:hypothetical protein